MRLLAPILGALTAWFIDQACATSPPALENTFNSPANISARARVQKPTACPSQCDSYDTSQWFVYSGTSRVALCNETMLLDFTVQNPLNDTDKRHTVRSCVTSQSEALETAPGGTSCLPVSSQSESAYQVGLWSGADSTVSYSSSEGSSMLNAISAYMTGNCQKSSIFAFSESAHIAVGMHIGGSVHYSQNIDSAVKEITSILQDQGSYQSITLQHCGKNANFTLGIAVDLSGDLSVVQRHVQTWNDGDCVSGFTTSNNVTTTLSSAKSSALSIPAGSNTTLSRRSSHKKEFQRRSTCSYVQVVSGDSCSSLVTECGITSDEFYQYNPASNLCSALAVGEYVCCSAGSLPDLAPAPSADGTCYTYDVKSGDSCSAIAAAYTLTVDNINNFNSDTWGWYGCDDLQAGSSICLSNGTAPLPLPVANAVCGPQVPGTDFTGATDAGAWAALNPCPLNACCDIWGQCGTTPDYCNYTLAASGAPGTAPPGSNGCIWNCGTTIINVGVDNPGSFMTLGYFEASSTDRPCLQMNAFTIDPAKYTHVLFGFGNITSDYAISIAGAQEQFQYFTALVGMKRIISFGGWDFSTSPDTYMIFREGVTAANRDTFVKNVADFVTENDLDGVDFDWEYPGAPDIPGIPPASDDDGPNYLEFLTALRAALPDKSISITAPSSYWYLKAFPISEMADVVDFVTIMTYDLHGSWDFQGKWSEAGCPAGDCLYSHVNLTETMWALAMITKAEVATHSIVVGVSSYGRSFEMTTVGCWSSSCTWDVVGQPAPCTQTAGYISNAEINQILRENSDALSLYSGLDSTNILIYNQTQWVSYMDDANRANRTSLYQGYNFAGTGEWAIDLEEFEPYVSDLGAGITVEELESVFAGQNLDIADIPCYSVSSSTNTSDELDSVVTLGSAYIDQALIEYADNPKDWVYLMTSRHKTETCITFPVTGDGICGALDEDECFDGDITTGLFWASFLTSKLYANWIQWYDAFGEATFLSSLDISAIATTFTPTVVGDNMNFDSLISAFTSALGIATSVLPDGGGLLGDFNTGITTVQSILDLIPSASSFTLPTEPDLEKYMSSMLGTLAVSTQYALGNLSTTIFEYPSNATTKLPANLIAGPFHPVANYFYNVKIVETLDSGNFSALTTKLINTMNMYLVGAALVSGDYYVVKNAGISQDSCNGVASYYIDGACYMLAYPGGSPSTCVPDSSIQTEATNDTITNIEQYGISVPDMILSSEACQNTTQVYFGTQDVDVNEVISSGKLPDCFFNLPVLQLYPVTIQGEKHSPSGEGSPCFVSQVMNISVFPATVGQSYLPPNLVEPFDHAYCTCGYIAPCQGTMNGTTNGTTNGANIVC